MHLLKQQKHGSVWLLTWNNAPSYTVAPKLKVCTSITYHRFILNSLCWCAEVKLGRSLDLTAPYLLERVQQWVDDHIHSPGLCCWCWSRAALLTSARRVRCQRRTRPTGSCRGSCPAAGLPPEPDEAQVTLTVNNSLLDQSNWKETSTKDSNIYYGNERGALLLHILCSTLFPKQGENGLICISDHVCILTLTVASARLV